MITTYKHTHTEHCQHDHEDMHDEDLSLIPIHNAENFESMRRAGKLASQALDFLEPHLKPGITTNEIDTLCHDFMISHGSISATLGYHGFPKSCCTSVNHVVCHGIPGEKKLMDGDILSLDVSLILDGWYGDNCRTYPIGKTSLRACKLIDVTYEALMRGIEQVKPGATIGDIGHAIQSYAQAQGFSVVRDFCGHGLGQVFHAAPSVPHFGRPGRGIELKEGMFFTIEPMINAGKYDIKVLDDGWTAVTRDKSLSAQFEHSLGVTATGVEIFTLS